MPALPRKTQQVFASGAVPSGNIAVYGSLAAGAPAYSSDPATIQSSAWLTGLAAALVGNHSIAQEDLNGVLLVLSQQIAYLLQSGAPEYDAGTTYWKNQLARLTGKQFLASSLTDNNTGHDPATDSNNWDTTALSAAIQASTLGQPNQTVVLDDTANKVKFAAIGWNPQGYWDNVNNVYTAPAKGLYRVNVTTQLDYASPPNGIDGFLRVSIDGDTGGYLWAQGWGQNSPPEGRWYPHLAADVPLNAGDKICIYIGGSINGASGGSASLSNSFVSVSRNP